MDYSSPWHIWLTQLLYSVICIFKKFAFETRFNIQFRPIWYYRQLYKTYIQLFSSILLMVQCKHS